MSDERAATPWHLWLVGVIAVLFNAIGVFDFVMSMAQGAHYLASAGMTPDQIAHYQGMPIWMTIVWATGVFSAFVASFLLLLRKAGAASFHTVVGCVPGQPPLYLRPHGWRRGHGATNGDHECHHYGAAGLLQPVRTVHGLAARTPLAAAPRRPGVLPRRVVSAHARASRKRPHRRDLRSNELGARGWDGVARGWACPEQRSFPECCDLASSRQAGRRRAYRVTTCRAAQTEQCRVGD